ncbi:carboxypeptidase regulatory-like domain-containing protein [Chitinophaga sp. 212800010-3]|uniref:TonB-dependent receptor n=1 Tax=unclassified Chitinophaga TaxID=2619133 RepID=UPI002DF20B22|nr:Carboxypeptidase regulatory-like domain-containing protein [Chitinophaga sp. 212800010-3]
MNIKIPTAILHSMRSAGYIILLLGVGILSAKAQETNGSLSGKVTDSTAGFIPGAAVIAVHEPTGTRYVTTTNELGRYYLVNLRVGGPYSVKVTAMGMREKSQNNLTIALGDPVTIDFILIPAVKTLAVVEIKDTRPPKANATGAGYNVSASQLRNLAAGARSFQDYTRLTPQYNGNSFAGTNFRYNNVTIDGAINNDAIGFSPSLGGQTGTSGQIGSSTRTNSISIDAIQDIQVYIAPYDVKIGNFTGGSINAVTRGGSNTVTGSIYGFGRNASLVGKDVAGGTGKMPSDYHDVQTGFRIGFPIIRNKLFFFTNEELTDRVDPLTATAASSFVQDILTQDQAEQIRDYYKRAELGFDPGTAGAYNVYSRSKKFFNRLDWNISDKHQLAIRSNVVISEATNLTRDDQNFRFSSIDYVQRNNQVATVGELKTRFNDRVANSLIVGYTTVKDYRDPLSYGYYPQIQIGGNTLGTTILLGTDREASIFNLRQNSLEITDNVTLFKGNHTITLGTHNELYRITYGFVNSPNGRIDYPTLTDFLTGSPSRIRGNFSYANQDRDYLLAHPSARFKVNLYSVYLQDEIVLSKRLKLTPGLRLDMTDVPDKQLLSLKTRNAIQDVFYGNSYTYTRPADIRNVYLGQVQLSPRLGVNFDIRGDKSLVLRGGTGLFIGRIPFAWLGYAFYNNGNTYGAFDKRYNYAGNPTAIPPVPPTAPNKGTDPRVPSRTGIAGTAVNENGLSALDVNGPTQIDLIDNHFKVPQVWRTSAALDMKLGKGYKLSLEAVYTKAIYDLQFRQINQQDSVAYYQYDAKQQQPVFTGRSTDPAFTSMYLLTNTSKGYRYSLTAQLSRSFPFGLDVFVAYTYGESKDVANGIRNSMESNWQLNQSLNPNDPELAWSNFDIRHRIVSAINYHLGYGRQQRFQTNVNLFFSTASGAPFTYGFVNSPVNIQGTGQQVSLAYIPKPEEMINFFRTGTLQLADNTQVYKTAADQAQEFEQYIRSVSYLRGRRGQFTQRNAAHTPWNTTADLRIAETFSLSQKAAHAITISWDIFNVLNLLHADWGKAYFSSDLFNSSASVGLRPTGANKAGFPIYIWEQPSTPYQVDLYQSRWQMQLGVRYNF